MGSPSLNAPGFITGQADMKVDASSAMGGDLVMKVRTTTPDYAGYKVSFAASSVNPTLACATGGSFALGRGCFKAPFTVPAGTDFTEIRIPLTEFSDKWSSATGEPTTLCSDDPSVCPTANKLKNVQRVAIWGGGTAGKVYIEVDSVAIEPPAVAVPLSSVVSATEIVLESFDAAVHTWSSQNDPVMGGKSTSTFTIADGIGTLNGTCAIFPSLSAPGFITARTSDSTKFPDVSNCQGLTLTTRSQSSPANYDGYRVSFGSDSAFLQCGKFFARGFKADFKAGEGEYETVQIPFDMFTKCWDDATGDAVKTCKDFPQFCPSSSRLQDLQTLSIWAEGKEADVKLDIKEVGAYGCSTVV